MKSEDLIKRQATKENGTKSYDRFRPWAMGDPKEKNRIVTLFEGEIMEDGTIIPGEGFENPLLTPPD